MSTASEREVIRASAGSFRGAWRHSPWRRLLAGFATSMTADFSFAVTIVVLVLERTGSPGWVAAAVVARLVPAVLLAPIGGLLADGGHPRRVLITSDLTRCASLVATAGSAALELPVVIIIGLTALVGVAAGPYRATVIASTASLVDVDDLVAANAANSAAGEVAWFVGTVGGAGLLALGGAELALITGAGCFAVAAAMVGFSQAAPANGSAGVGATGPIATRELRTGLAQGGRALAENRGLLVLLGFTATVFVAFGVEQVAHVLVARDRLGLGARGVGVLAAAIGLGAVLAAPIAGRLAAGRRGGVLLAGAGVLIGAPLALLAATTALWVAVPLLVVEGAAGVVFEVLVVTYLQRSCPGAVLATVSSFQSSASGAAQLFGSLAAPLLIAAGSLEVALIVTGAGVATASVLFAPALDGLAGAAESRRRELAPIVDRLASLGLLEGASRVALERLAAETATRSVPAGAVVFREGDVTDHFYVVLAGELSVHSSGENAGPEVEVNRLRAGDWFGEIGLLHQRSRTATVRASSDSTLLSVPGGAFLEAVSGSDVLPDPLRRTMVVRLTRTHPGLVSPVGPPDDRA